MDAFADGKVDVVPDVSIGSVKGTKQLALYSNAFFYFAATKGSEELMAELDEAISTLNRVSPDFQANLAQKYLNNTLGLFFITEEEADYIREKKTIRALCVPDCAPFVICNGQGEWRGIAVSMMEDFAQRTGLTVEYTRYDRSQPFYDVFHSGEFDCVLGIPVNNAYNTQLGVVTSAPYLSTEQVYFTKHNAAQLSFEDAKIAMLRGSALAESHQCKEVLFYDTTEQCIDAVVAGKADGGYGNQYCVEYYSQHNFVNLSIVPLVGEQKNMEISVSRKENPAFLALLNRYIEHMESGQIYGFHFAANEEHNNTWFKILMFSDPLKSALLVAAFATVVLMAIAMFFFAKSSRKKNRALQIASNAKSDFLSRVSHDMRTPMNAILSFSSMNLDETVTEAQLVSDMQQIHRSGQYLLGLINDVLDMSKIEHQKMELRLESILPGKLVKEILNAMEPVMAEQKLVFQVELHQLDQETAIVCDVMRTKQVLINLLSNAAKFTPEGGTVLFRVENTERTERDATHRFTVKDTGIGMSPEFQKSLFEPFAQERNEKTGQLTGTGLGLAIVKELVDLMGGTITVQSQQNAGSEFVVELRHALAQTVQPLPKKADTLPENFLTGRHILLAEDHPINAEIIRRMLAKQGAETDHAENGQLAVERFEASPPGYYDAVLMDIRMPVMDGLTAAQAIRQLPRADAGHVPIVAISANAFDEDVEKSRQAGMNQHLSKPIDPARLYAALCELVRK